MGTTVGLKAQIGLVVTCPLITKCIFVINGQEKPKPPHIIYPDEIQGILQDFNLDAVKIWLSHSSPK